MFCCRQSRIDTTGTGGQFYQQKLQESLPALLATMRHSQAKVHLADNVADSDTIRGQSGLEGEARPFDTGFKCNEDLHAFMVKYGQDHSQGNEALGSDYGYFLAVSQ